MRMEQTLSETRFRVFGAIRTVDEDSIAVKQLETARNKTARQATFKLNVRIPG